MIYTAGQTTVSSVRIPFAPPVWLKSHILRLNLWRLSPTAAAISHFSAGLLLGGVRSLFSERPPFISEALDSADSVRFWKIQRFEGPIDFNEMRFCGSSRTGESVRFQLPYRCLNPSAQPTTRSTRRSRRAPVETATFYRLFVRLSQVSSLPKMATLARICRKSPAQTAEIPVFVETIGGDWFDHHWTVGVAVNLRRFGPLDGGAACAAIVRQDRFSKLDVPMSAPGR